MLYTIQSGERLVRRQSQKGHPGPGRHSLQLNIPRKRIRMRLARRSAVFVLLAVLSFGQDSKPQSAPPKQTGTPPAVMSPKATIPSPGAEGTKPAVETDPAKLAAPH